MGTNLEDIVPQGHRAGFGRLVKRSSTVGCRQPLQLLRDLKLAAENLTQALSYQPILKNKVNCGAEVGG
jgi:hypothetical protein